MPSLVSTQTGEPIILKRQLAKSGEGTIWTIPEPGKVVKIYHKPSRLRADKLVAMLKNPPDNPYVDKAFIPVAWPESLIQTEGGDVVGFIMPLVEGGRELIDIYNPSRRKRVGVDVNWKFLHVAAHNIASVIDVIHAKDYILGDIKAQNILINNQGLPAIIDTDSFQVRHPHSGLVYRCLVGSEGYTPPELVGQDLSQVNQTVVHDYFRLGVIIYQLLMGSHPFQGRWRGEGDPPHQTELIKTGQWVFNPHSDLQSSPLTIPLKVLHPLLQTAFERCFTDGANNPGHRPSAKEWQWALGVAIENLQSCPQVKEHYFDQQHSHCFWCDRQRTLGIDIFETPDNHNLSVKDDSSLEAPQTSAPMTPAKSLAPNPLRGNSLKPTKPAVKTAAHSSGASANHPYDQSWLSLLADSTKQQKARKERGQRRKLVASVSTFFLVISAVMVGWLIQDRPNTFPAKASLPSSTASRNDVNRPNTNPTQQSQTQIAVTTPPNEHQKIAVVLTRSAQQDYLRRNHQYALSRLNQAILIDPNLAEAYYYRGLVKKTLGQVQEAQKDWQQALSLAPNQMPFHSQFPSLEQALPLTNPQPVSQPKAQSLAPEASRPLTTTPTSGAIVPTSVVPVTLVQPSISLPRNLPPRSSENEPLDAESVQLPPLNTPESPQSSSVTATLNELEARKALSKNLERNTLSNGLNTQLAKSLYQRGVALAEADQFPAAISTLMRSAQMYRELGDIQTANLIEVTSDHYQKTTEASRRSTPLPPSPFKQKLPELNLEP